MIGRKKAPINDLFAGPENPNAGGWKVKYEVATERAKAADETLSILLELEPQLSKYRIKRSDWQGGGSFWDLEGIRAAKKFRDDQANAEKYLPESKYGDEKELAELLGDAGVTDPKARETVREFAAPELNPIPKWRGNAHYRAGGFTGRTGSDSIPVKLSDGYYFPQPQTVSLSPTDRQLLRDIAKPADFTVAPQKSGRSTYDFDGFRVRYDPGLYRLGNGMVVEKRPGGWWSPNGSKRVDREVSFSATLTRLEVAK